MGVVNSCFRWRVYPVVKKPVAIFEKEFRINASIIGMLLETYVTISEY